MRLTARLFFLLSVFVVSTLQAQFTAGNLAVLRAENAGANNTNFSIVEINPSTANQALPVTTVAINGSAGNTALRQRCFNARICKRHLLLRLPGNGGSISTEKIVVQ